MSRFSIGLLCYLLVSSALVFAPPPKKNGRNNLKRSRDLFERTYRYFAHNKGVKLSLARLIGVGLTVGDALSALSEQKSLDRKSGRASTLLKVALYHQARPGLIGFLLQKGARAKIPVASSCGVLEEPLFVHTFKLRADTESLIATFFAPDVRDYLFPGGVEEAIEQYKQAEPFAFQRTLFNGKLQAAEKYIREWGASEGINFGVIDKSKTTSPICSIKEHCEDYLRNHEDVGLDDIVYEGKTLRMLFDFLHQAGQLHVPSTCRFSTRKRRTLIRLALKNSVKKEVVDYLLSHGAPVTFFNVRHQCERNIFWQVYSSAAKEHVIRALFSPEQRIYVFNDDVTYARKLWDSYQLFANSATVKSKNTLIEEVLCAWEEEERVKSLDQVPNETIDGALMQIETDAEIEPVMVEVQSSSESQVKISEKRYFKIFLKSLIDYTEQAFINQSVEEDRTWIIQTLKKYKS